MTTLAPPQIKQSPKPEIYGEAYSGKLFEDRYALDDVIARIKDLEAPISLKDQEGLLEKTAQLVQPESKGLIITVGPCVGELAIEETVEMVVAHHLAIKDAVTAHSGLQDEVAKVILDQSITLHRAANYEKPRSNLFENVNDKEVYSIMGPAINDEENRTPDPANLLTGTQTSYEILTKSTARIREIEGAFAGIYFAREGLVTPRLRAEMRGPKGARYNGFNHVVWLGNRTRGEGNPQEKELAKLEKTHIQIKIDQHTTHDEIIRLHKKFNPDNIDGKIGFILRIGVAHIDKIQEIVEAIQEYSANSLIISDPMHNNTYTYSNNKTTQKTRSLEDIEAEMSAVINACKHATFNRPDRPIRCHGIHLEAGDGVNETECINTRSNHPTKKPKLDPLLNMRQLTDILSKFVKKSL